MISASEFLKGNAPTGKVSKNFVSAADFLKSNPAPTKSTLGQKVLNTGTAVSNFFGGKGLTDAIGGTIAMNKASDQEKAYIDLPTNKQVLASIGELGVNIATLPVGGEVVKGALAVPKAIKYGKLAAEGAGIVGATSALHSVQEGNNVFSKETGKAAATGLAIGAVAGPALSVLGEGAGNLLRKKVTAAEFLAQAEKKAAFEAVPEAGKAPEGYIDRQTPLLGAPKVPTMLPAPNKPLMLEAKNPKTSTLGDNFSYTDKPNAQKVEISKALQDYNAKLKSYNQNPTPNKLKITLKAKEVLEAKSNIPVTAPIVPKEVLPTSTPKYNTNIPESKPVSTSEKLPSIKGNRVTSEAHKINESFVQKGVDELAPEEKAMYKGFNESEQKAKVLDYMNNDENFYQDVANGKPPKDVVPQIAYNAVKAKAAAMGDFETQRLLAKNPIITQRSQAASTLRAAQVAANPDDAVEIMHQVNKHLETTIEKKLGKPLVEARKEVLASIKNEVAKVKVTKQTFKEFINSIQC